MAAGEYGRACCSAAAGPVGRFGGADGWQMGEQFDGGFEVLLDGRSQGRLRWDLMGAHLKSVECAGSAGGGAMSRSRSKPVSLRWGNSKNVKRRMEVRGTVNSVTVYDDLPIIRPQSDHARRAAAQGRIGADSGGAGAALEYHEAGGDEGVVARQPGRLPIWCSATPVIWAGMPPPYSPRWVTRRIHLTIWRNWSTPSAPRPRAIRCW